MKRNILKEDISLKTKLVQPEGKTPFKVIYVVGEKYGETKLYVSIFKKYSAKWNSYDNVWQWAIYSNVDYKMVIDKFIKPCLKEIRGCEDVLDEIDKLINEFEHGSETYVPQKGGKSMSENDIKNKLEAFKVDLISCVNSEDFKKKMEPIINRRNALGHSYSLMNSLLIAIQDPQATLVKSRNNWLKYNREVLPGAQAICMIAPMSRTKDNSSKESKAAKRAQSIARFLSAKGKRSQNELTLGEKEQLRVYLSDVGLNPIFKYGPYWFDVRFTKPIDGKEDLLGDIDTSKIEWNDNSGAETSDMIEFYDNIIELIKAEGLSIEFVDNLGGALGQASYDGKISVLKDGARNAGKCSTLVHEFAHELLHFSWLKNKNKDLADFFAGTQQGRGYVEQQAEMVAWMVMKNFGYDMPTALNYMGSWGMEPKTCVVVFDSVFKVSEYIISKMTKLSNKNNIGDNDTEEETMDESKKYIKESRVPQSPQELADMFGYGDEYRKGQEEMKQEMNVRESFNNMLGKLNNHKRTLDKLD